MGPATPLQLRDSTGFSPVFLSSPANKPPGTHDAIWNFCRNPGNIRQSLTELRFFLIIVENLDFVKTNFIFFSRKYVLSCRLPPVLVPLYKEPAPEPVEKSWKGEYRGHGQVVLRRHTVAFSGHFPGSRPRFPALFSFSSIEYIGL